MPVKGNMLIAQSGGPTAAINASLAGAVSQAMRALEIGEIYGARNGIDGVLKNDLVDLRPLLSRKEDLELLRNTPAMALGSCRRRLSERPDESYETILKVLKERDIRYFFYIGGNDSMDTVKKLSAWFQDIGENIKVVGIPKTIDNDIACTDHTPGFGSAARYIATCVTEVACDSAIYDLPSMTLLEIMGRDAGWLTAAAALARRPGCTAPHIICMPEVPFDGERFLARADALRKEHQHLIIAVSEGIRYADGQYVAAGDKDPFGHRQLAGAAHTLGNMIRERFGCKLRAIELNVLQRSAAHLQSGRDIEEAWGIGAQAVAMALSGKTGIMASFVRMSDDPYLIRYDYAQIDDVANVEKAVPLEWIDEQNMDVKEELLRYLAPLIASADGKDSGLPAHFHLK